MKIYPDDGRPKKWPEITRRTCSHFIDDWYCLIGICKSSMKRGEKEEGKVKKGKWK
jgi:hypothetical protein